MDKNNDIHMNTLDEQIDSFIRGMMTTEEEAAFKDEIKSDTELRNQVLATVSLIKGIREQEAEREKGLFIVESYARSRTLLKWACSIAAAIILIFGYNFYAENSRYSRVNAMLSPYYVQYDLDELSRGETDTATISHLYTLFNRIPEEKDMKEIIAELEPIYESLDSDFTYYPYANDIAWNLALAYVKAGNKKRAIFILNTIVRDNEDSPIEAKANALIQILNSSK